MYCPKCGKENVTHAKFCAYCGALLPQENEDAAQGRKPLPEGKTTAQKAFSPVNLTKSMIVTIVGALVTFISIFVPLYSFELMYDTVSFNYFSINRLTDEYDTDYGTYTVIGLLFLVFAIVTVIMKLKANDEAGRIISIIAVGLAVAMIVVTKNSITDFDDFAKVGIGPFLCLVGTIVELTGSIMKN